MQILFGIAHSINDHLLCSGLGSFDSFETTELFGLGKVLIFK